MSTEEAIPERKTKQKLPVINVNPYDRLACTKYRFSVSQIDTWSLCKRKWGFQKIEKIEGTNRYAQRGLAVHGHLENWLIDGIPPPDNDKYGVLARTALAPTMLLPPPGTCEVERSFLYISRNGIPYLGFMDVWEREKIYDHKTTTDIKWRKLTDAEWENVPEAARTDSPGPLSKNTQACLYATVSAARYNVSKVPLSWIYYVDKNKPGPAKPVNIVLERSKAEAVVDAMDVIAAEIIEIGWSAETARDLPANPGACESYGGCPYRERCGLTAEEMLEAIMTQSSIRTQLMHTPKITVKVKDENMSLLEQMKAKAAAAKNLEATPPASQTPTPMPAGAGSLMERLKAQAAPAIAAVAAQSPQNMQPQQPRVVSNPAAPGNALMERMRARAAGAVFPPAEEVSTPPVVMTPPATAKVVSHAPDDINPPEKPEVLEDDPDKLAAAVAYAQEQQELDGDQPLVQTGDVPVALETPSQQAEKKKRGRPAGSTSAHKESVVVQSGLSDCGYIWATVYAEALKQTLGDVVKANDCATAAVVAFRKLMG